MKKETIQSWSFGDRRDLDGPVFEAEGRGVPMRGTTKEDRLNRDELSWSDFDNTIVEETYPRKIRALFSEELTSRIAKWRRVRNGQPLEGYTPLETLEREIVARTNPEVSLKFKGGAGPFARLLSKEAADILSEFTRQDGGPSLQGLLLDKGKGKWIIDQRLLNIALLAAQTKAYKEYKDATPEYLAETVREAVLNAAQTTGKIFTNPLFAGLGAEATDWRSLFEQLVKSRLFESFTHRYNPQIITSVGGDESAPVVAAPGNILPALELTTLLRKEGYQAECKIRFASEFAIACNGVDPDKTRANQSLTQDFYEQFISEYYRDLWFDSGADLYAPEAYHMDGAVPQDYINFTRACVEKPEILGEKFVSTVSALPRKALESLNASEVEREKTLKYLLSHQYIFGDVQTRYSRAFVIKVGAPSERRFSEFQQQVTEAYMNRGTRTQGVMVPNSPQFVNDENGGKWKYGQITLYYPRLGSRPPYYPETPDEPNVLSDIPEGTFSDFKRNLGGSVERYAALERNLGLAGIDPDDYLRFIRWYADSAKG
jgi:hypothetical protein